MYDSLPLKEVGSSGTVGGMLHMACMQQRLVTLGIGFLCTLPSVVSAVCE